MLLLVIKKFPIQTEWVIQLWFSDSIRITNTHLILEPEFVSSIIFRMSASSKMKHINIMSYLCYHICDIGKHTCLIIFNENHVALSMILEILCVTINFRHHYHLKYEKMLLHSKWFSLYNNLKVSMRNALVKKAM